jgi:hypothetical protein
MSSGQVPDAMQQIQERNFHWRELTNTFGALMVRRFNLTNEGLMIARNLKSMIFDFFRPNLLIKNTNHKINGYETQIGNLHLYMNCRKLNSLLYDVY